MPLYEQLSCAELFAIHDRQMEQVANCLRLAERRLRESDRLLRGSNKLLEREPRRGRYVTPRSVA